MNLGMSRERQKKNQKNSAENLAIVTQPGEFFKSQIHTAIEKQKLRVDESVEHYLVTLLSRFMVSENLFATTEEGNHQEETLALLYQRAIAAENSETQQTTLRRLGDVSLYTAGFFGDRLSRKVVDVDYYIGMGRNAYSSLAQMPVASIMQRVFKELAKQFPRFVDVLAHVSEKAMPQSEKNLLRLYELWLKTGSERAEKSLTEAGIIPNTTIKNKPQ